MDLIVLSTTPNQQSQSLLFNPALIALFGVIIGWLLNFATSIIQERRRYRINILQTQEQAYSQLAGLKIMLDQLYLSVNDAFVLFGWIDALERLALPIPSKLGKIEEKRRAYNELIVELARNNQKLWETIGLIRLLFAPSEKLDEPIKTLEISIIKIREYREAISIYYENVAPENVDIPPDAAQNGIEQEIGKYVDIPIENLQKYLEEEIKAEKIKLENPWWKF